MSDDRWEDLSDAELRARLMQRGQSRDEAARLVRWRDAYQTEQEIDRLLGGEDPDG